MSFLRGVSELNAKLVHHTGSMIRFVPSQLRHLPASDADCRVLLPDGQVVSGHFRRHPANPYIAGREVVRWLKSWVPYGEPVSVKVHQEGAGSILRLTLASSSSASTKDPALQRRVLRKASRGDHTERPERRRRFYSTLERDPQLRELALLAWGGKCQVQACTALRSMPEPLRTRLVDVHHLNHVSAGGPDSPLNLCVVCVSHHALIHRAGTSILEACDLDGATVRVNGTSLRIVRNARLIW